MKLLKFSAIWCGPCQTMKTRLESFNACPVIEYDVDDDANDDLCTKYGIVNIPTMILVDENNTLLKKWVGLVDVNDITSEVEKYK